MRTRTLLILGLSAPVLLSGLVGGFFLETIHSQQQRYLTYEVATYIVLPLGCLVALHKVAGLSCRDYGLNGAQGFADAMRSLPALLLALLAFFSLVPVQFIAELIFPVPADAFSYKYSYPDGVSKNVWNIYLAISAAVIEEIFYRGVMEEALIGKSDAVSDRWRFILASSLLFGINHWPQGAASVIASTYIGILAALFYLRYPNLWFLILAHFAFDFWVGSSW